MKPEFSPISDDEWLLRRVRIERFRNDKTPIISPNAFEPRLPGPKVRDPDIEGISFYRQECLTSIDDILASIPSEKRGGYGIVRVSMSQLRHLNLTAEMKPDPLILGHVVIPEINSTDYAANKVKFTSILLRLAEVASEEENIVRRPNTTSGAP